MEKELGTEKSLNQHLRAQGIKQTHLAQHMGVSESQVSLLLRGKRRMNFDQAYMISEKTGLSLDQVYAGLKLNQKYIEEYL